MLVDYTTFRPSDSTLNRTQPWSYPLKNIQKGTLYVCRDSEDPGADLRFASTNPMDHKQGKFLISDDSQAVFARDILHRV